MTTFRMIFSPPRPSTRRVLGGLCLSLGLGLVLLVYRRFKTLDADRLNEMQG